MLRRRLYFSVTTVVMFLCFGLCYATEIIPSTLEYMTGFSDTIVIGHVDDKYSYWENQRIYSNVAITVERFVKSTRGEASFSIQLKVPGGRVGDMALEIDQAPVFRAGEKVMLFLKRIDGSHYFPYGLNYGVCKIFWDEDTEKEVIDGPFFNQPEHYDLSTMTAVKNREPMGKTELEPFLERIEKLIR